MSQADAARYRFSNASFVSLLEPSDLRLDAAKSGRTHSPVNGRASRGCSNAIPAEGRPYSARVIEPRAPPYCFLLAGAFGRIRRHSRSYPENNNNLS